MPNSVIHMWIAREFAKNKPYFQSNPNYYLGNIAPDAVLGRADCNSELKNKFHLLNQKTEWEKDVLNYWNEHPKRTPYLLGYVMHILTDIQFRNSCRKFEDDNQIPLEDRDRLLFIATAINIRNHFETKEDYYDMINFTEQYSISAFGLDLCDDDIKKNLNFAKKAFHIWPMPESSEINKYPIIDMNKISIETVEYLQEVLSLENIIQSMVL